MRYAAAAAADGGLTRPNAAAIVNGMWTDNRVRCVSGCVFVCLAEMRCVDVESAGARAFGDVRIFADFYVRHTVDNSSFVRS